LAKRVAGFSFSAEAVADIDVSLTAQAAICRHCGKLSELQVLRSRQGRRHPRCSQVTGEH
jgi:hypothetical protein